jgi:hypothetical protein
MQKRFKSLRGYRPVFSVGSEDTENFMGFGCVLDALSFIRSNEDREMKTHYFVAPKSVRGPAPSQARQVACLSQAGAP